MIETDEKRLVVPDQTNDHFVGSSGSIARGKVFHFVNEGAEEAELICSTAGRGVCTLFSLAYGSAQRLILKKEN